MALRRWDVNENAEADVCIRGPGDGDGPRRRQRTQVVLSVAGTEKIREVLG